MRWKRRERGREDDRDRMCVVDRCVCMKRESRERAVDESGGFFLKR